MSNTIADGAFRQLWLEGVQEDLDKKLVAKGIGSVDTRPSRIFHNPFNSTPVGSNGAKQLTYSVEDMTSSDNTLTVQQRATAAEHIDSYEEMMTSYGLMAQQEQRQAYRIADYIDQYVLNKPVGFSGVRKIDNGVMGGGASDSAPYAMSSTNANSVANKIFTYLALGNGAIEKGITWVVSPYDVNNIVAYAQSHGFNLEDESIQNGFNGSIGKKFGGLSLVQSNNLTHTATLTIATNPTAGDYLVLTVNGRSITITFRASPSVAGECKIGASAAATQTNLRAMLNGSGTGDGTDYFEFATADRTALKMVSPQSAPGTFALCGAFATNAATLTVYGSLAVAKSLTAGGDGFSTVARHSIALVNGSIFVALPGDGMSLDVKAVTGKHGREVVTAQVYDATIWNNDSMEVLEVIISG
jgi:hypothetical protein